jgi:uncharacterized membrane protein
MWTEETGFNDLGLQDDLSSAAFGVNADGMATGRIGGSAVGSGFVWDGSALIEFAPAKGGSTILPRAVNCAQQVVGTSQVPDRVDDHGEAFLWQDGETVLLPMPQICSSTGAWDISERGQVIGSCTVKDASNEFLALFWPGNGEVRDLNKLLVNANGLTVTRGRAINGSGVLLANAEDAAGNLVAVVLTPVDLSNADLNTDCEVNALDLIMLLELWGPQSSTADLNGDGVVGPLDLAMLLADWG